MERKKRRWWTRGITWLSLVAIGGALLSGLFQLAVALAPDYRDELAAKASTALGQPVQVDELSLRWRWLWPLLELEGLRLMDAEGRESVATIERVRLGFSLLEMLRGEWVPAEVEVTGLTLALQRTADGQLRLKGRVSGGRAPSFAEVAAQIKRFSRLRASAVALTLEDQTHPEAGFAATLQKADLRLSEQGFELRAELAAPQALASRLRLRAGFTGDLAEPAGWQGRWSLDATGLVAGAPLAARWPALAALRLGEARVDAAGDWQAGQPGASELSFAAQAMQLDHTPGSALREVDIGLRYRPTATGATLDVVPLRLTGARGTWPVSSARLQWQREAGKAAPAYSGSGEFLRLDDLAPWLAAFWPDAAQRPLLASLAGDLTGLEGRWQQGDAAPRYRLHGRFAKLGARWGERLAFDNASGELTADESGGELDLKSPGMGLQLPQTFENAMRFDALDAKAQWRRQGEAWQLTLPGFAWSLLGSEGRGNAEMRLKAGERPVLKLAAEFDARDAAALKPLMPRHWGQSLKDWLTRAVVRGRVSAYAISDRQ